MRQELTRGALHCCVIQRKRAEHAKSTGQVSQASVQARDSTLARAGRKDGAEARPRRAELPRLSEAFRTKALITGGDSGMGRAAAIAYAREGADVAINYFPSEEPDAREVMELIREAGRKGVAIPGGSVIHGRSTPIN